MNATWIQPWMAVLVCTLAGSCAGSKDSGATATGGADSAGHGGTNTASGGTNTASGGTNTASGGTNAASGGTNAASGGSPASPTCDGARPGPDNTGVPPGTVLKPSGSIKVETEGAVIENLDIQGEIAVLADNVIIRRVRIRSGDYYPIRYFDNDNHGLVVEDSEIEGTSDDVTAALSFANYTARRLNVHGGADGFKADENVLIEDCWIHDLRNGSGQHNDGVQSTGGKGVTLRHNSISGASNACVQTGDEGARTEDLTVECNWLSGGGYALNIRGTGATRPRNTKILNNRFARDSEYGPWTIDDPSPTVLGNVYDDGTPLSYP